MADKVTTGRISQTGLYTADGEDDYVPAHVADKLLAALRLACDHLGDYEYASAKVMDRIRDALRDATQQGG